MERGVERGEGSRWREGRPVDGERGGGRWREGRAVDGEGRGGGGGGGGGGRREGRG